MLIRRKFPPLVALIGCLFLASIGAALGRRLAFMVANVRIGMPALAPEPLLAIQVGAETVILFFAFFCSMGVLRFHRASRRVLNVLLACAILLCVYKGVRAIEHQELSLLALYGAALTGVFIFLFAFNRIDIAEMYAPAWAGHDIPEHPLPAAALALVGAAGVGIGLALHRLQPELMRWLNVSW